MSWGLCDADDVRLSLATIEDHLEALDADAQELGRTLPDVLAERYHRDNLDAWLSIRRGLDRHLLDVRCGIGANETLDTPIDDPKRRGRWCRRPIAQVHSSFAGAVLIDFGRLGESQRDVWSTEIPGVLAPPPDGPAAFMLSAPLPERMTGMCSRHGAVSYSIADLRTLLRASRMKGKVATLPARL